jgi:prepilin-type N-terminal cleavage/methylation domain-containing protein
MSPGGTTGGTGAEAGFTLVELLLGVILAAIFSVGLYAFFFAGTDAARTHESQARAQADGRTAIDRIVRDARQAISPDDGLTAPIVALGPSSLELYVDARRSPASTSPRPHKVRYAVVADQLVRESAAPVGAAPPYTYGPYAGREVLLERLRNGATPVFRAVTAEGVSLPATVSGPQARDIALVSIRLLIAQKTGNAATTLELTTDAHLRNAIRL